MHGPKNKTQICTFCWFILDPNQICSRKHTCNISGCEWLHNGSEIQKLAGITVNVPSRPLLHIRATNISTYEQHSNSFPLEIIWTSNDDGANTL